MTLSFTRTGAILGATLLATGAALVMPTAATAANYGITIDCADSTADYDVDLVEGDTLQITLVNCTSGVTATQGDGLDGFTEDLNTITGDAVVHYTAGGENTYSTITFADEVDSDFLYINVYPIVDDPSGALLATEDVTIAGGTVMTIPGDPGDEYNLADNSDCTLESGPHPYSVLHVTITEAGDYTFRIVGSASEVPAGDEESAASDDPYLAVYGDFDPANPDANVVGCNDDRDSDAFSTSGQTLQNLYSEFGATFEPGNYTLVLTGYGSFAEADWVFGDQTSTFELWGPEGGLTVGAPEVTELAETGARASELMPVGIALMIAGVAVMAIRRARA